ncbi:Carbohydrate-binding-like fold [Abeliophyllum distichum]|uniref:Carbohydrate-binding-like fold n=1 Tax=Abeliophyllum distichum TaxID=126358 RepID=A0ABD1QX44_9LAMI
METIRDSYLKVFVCSYNKERWVLCPRNFSPEISFLGHQKRVSVGLSLSNSLQRKKFQPSFAASALSESDAQTQVASEETQINDSDEPKTIHVRFKLRKECAFGQQFLIVGDDPVFGLWDPSDAVPLNWSDGHVWLVELDLPSGKAIKYKFILKGGTEEIIWQRGPDRVLQTWETEKTITVLEDWDNPKLQMIIEEEELVTDPSAESMIDSELTMVAENLTQPKQDDGTDVNKESASTNAYFRLMENPSPDKGAEMVADNITEEKGEPDLSTCDEVSGLTSVTCPEKEDGVLGNDGRAINRSDSLNSRDEASLFSDEGVPVLVPGLITMPTEETREESPRGVEEKNAANILVQSDKPESSDMQEWREERASTSGTSETMIDKKEELNVHERVEKTIIIQSKEEPTVYERVEKPQQTEHDDIEEELQDSVLESDLRWGNTCGGWQLIARVARFVLNFQNRAF